MKINNANHLQMVNKLYKKNAKEGLENSKGQVKDRIEISNGSKQIQKYVDQIKSSKSYNQQRIENIKSQLESGSYKVSSEELAKKIVDELNKRL